MRKRIYCLDDKEIQTYRQKSRKRQIYCVCEGSQRVSLFVCVYERKRKRGCEREKRSFEVFVVVTSQFSNGPYARPPQPKL